MQFEVHSKEERNLKFEAFSRCFGSLCEAITYPESLAPMFYQEGLIPRELITEISALPVSDVYKSVKLMYFVLTHIKYNPDAFDQVLVILGRERPLEPLVDLLSKTLEALSSSMLAKQFEVHSEECDLKLEAFSRCYGNLCEAITCPESLAPMFYQEGLIPKGLISDMLVLEVPYLCKSTKLMHTLLIHIKYNPNAFDQVLAILRRERSLEPLMNLLSNMLEALSNIAPSPCVSVMPKVQLTGALCGPKYQRYHSVIYKYLYDAKDLYLHAYTKLLLNSSSVDLQICGVLSRAAAYYLSGRFKCGYKLLLKARKLCNSSSCENGEVLRTRVNCGLSTLFYIRGDHKKAIEYLKYAQEGIAIIEAGYDSSVVALLSGCMLQRTSEAEAGYCQAIKLKDRCCGPLYFIDQTASIALAFVYLNCSLFHINLYTPVSEFELRKAASLLERVDKEEFIPRRIMVKFNMAKSVLCFRQSKLSEAIHHASNAVYLSSQSGLGDYLQRTSGLLLQFLYGFRKTNN